MPTSITGWTKRLVWLEATLIWPLGTIWTFPSRSRSLVTRNWMSSTVPETSAMVTVSPTLNWSSTRMKNPAMKSFTISWAPKPTAAATTVPIARNGVMLMPQTPKITRMAVTSKVKRNKRLIISHSVSALLALSDPRWDRPATPFRPSRTPTR